MKHFHIGPIVVGYAKMVTMKGVHWIFTPFLLATICTTTGLVTGFPTPTTTFNTEIVTELVHVDQETQPSPAHVFDTQGTAQPLQTNASTSTSVVSTSASNNTGEAGIPPSAVSTLPTVNATQAPTTSTTRAVYVPSNTSSQLSTVQTTPSTTHLVPTVLHTTTTLSTTTAAVTTTTPTPQATAVITTTTPTAVPVHEATLRVSTTASASTSHEALLTSSTSTNLSDQQSTKESGDWNIIGITGNSFTGKILLPIAVGTALSVIIIAVAYCYCSRKGPRRLAKSSRNGVHRMTSNDRVMLLADSSEDEF